LKQRQWQKLLSVCVNFRSDKNRDSREEKYRDGDNRRDKKGRDRGHEMPVEVEVGQVGTNIFQISVIL